MVRFAVFMDAVEALSDSEAEHRQKFLENLSDNDRSQLLRALDLFGLFGQDGLVNEIGLRRLADPSRRSTALVELLESHYPEELKAIRAGIARDALEMMMSVPGRTSASTREKARQFLERAMEEAGLSTRGIRTARRSAGSETEVDTASSSQQPGLRLRYTHQQQQFLDQLLSRHGESEDPQEAKRLEDTIQSVSERLDRLLSDT